MAKHSPPPISSHAPRSKALYVFMAIMFGFVGAHNFYAKRTGVGFAQAAFLILALFVAATPIGIVSVLLLLALILWILVEIFVVKTDGYGVKMQWTF